MSVSSSDGDAAPADGTARPGTGTALLAGIVGGLVGTAAFGLVTTFLGLGFVRSFVPSLFGLPQRGAFGWTIHLATGAVLGAIFATIATRDPVAEVLAPTDPDAVELGPVDPALRALGAGIAYGLAVWALLPTLALPALVQYGGTLATSDLPGSSVETLAAHLVFGTLLGGIYGAVLARS